MLELQLTLTHFGHAVPLSGELDPDTWQATLALLGLRAGTPALADGELARLYRFFLARQWPRGSYVVREGESVAWLAGSFGVSAEALREVNLTGTITAGHQLRVPAAYTRHRVAPGETLAGIARTFGVTVRALCRWNHLEDPGLVGPGDHLLVVFAGG